MTPCSTMAVASCLGLCVSPRASTYEDLEHSSIDDSTVDTYNSFEETSESDDSEPTCMHDEHELLFNVEELRWENREAELMERRASAVHANHDFMKNLSQLPVLEANVQT